MENIKKLVEDIVEYTRTWSISETEWYWNIDCVRKSNYVNEKNITWEEFEVAIREEILYALIYDVISIANQIENTIQCGFTDKRFYEDTMKIVNEIRVYYSDFMSDIEKYLESEVI